jgi:hypothetical protein
MQDILLCSYCRIELNDKNGIRNGYHISEINHFNFFKIL